MEIVIDRAGSRGYANHGWLKSYHTFSFADYYNPAKMNFGALRVLNDDTVAPKQGFGVHPHKNMEVVSIPLSGYLRHGDNIENSKVISRGSIQLMSAGSGIDHSEFNDSASENVQFLQIWVMPKQKGTKPKYESHCIEELIRKDEISQFISPDGEISVLQDAWFSWGNLSKGVDRQYVLNSDNTGVYIFVIDGEIEIGDVKLSRRDGVAVSDIEKIDITALADSEFLLIEVAL